MIIDCHTHIFPAAVRQNREKYFRGEPAFELLYASPKARLVGAAELVAAMDAQGVDRSVVFGFPWRDARTARLNNDYVMEAVGRYPGRLVGLCCLDPFSPQAEAETRRCLEGGLAGIGELAFYQSGIDAAALDKLAPLMALCLTNGLVAMIHTNEPVGHLYPGKTPNTLRQIYDLVRRFPENKIVLAHWGAGSFSISCSNGRSRPRCKTFTSTPPLRRISTTRMFIGWPVKLSAAKKFSSAATTRSSAPPDISRKWRPPGSPTTTASGSAAGTPPVC